MVAITLAEVLLFDLSLRLLAFAVCPRHVQPNIFRREDAHEDQHVLQYSVLTTFALFIHHFLKYRAIQKGLREYGLERKADQFSP